MRVEARPPKVNSKVGTDILVCRLQRRVLQSWLKGVGRRSLLPILRGSELVAAAKSAGLSPKPVESYDEIIRARKLCVLNSDFPEGGRSCSFTVDLLFLVGSHFLRTHLNVNC
jgi:hypothetical protein